MASGNTAMFQIQSASQDHASLGVAATTWINPLSERRQLLVGIESSGAADGAEPCSGVPLLCFSAVHTVTSLASRVRAVRLLARPAFSFRRANRHPGAADIRSGWRLDPLALLGTESLGGTFDRRRPPAPPTPSCWPSRSCRLRTRAWRRGTARFCRAPGPAGRARCCRSGLVPVELRPTPL